MDTYFDNSIHKSIQLVGNLDYALAFDGGIVCPCKVET